MSRRRLMMASRSDSGLIFHAPLMQDFVDVVSGRALTVDRGDVAFTMNGAEFTAARLFLDDLSLPVGSDPCTLTIWIAPTDFGVGGEGTGYCDFFGYGRPEEGQARLVAANTDQLCGHLFARDYDAAFEWIMDGETWTHCAVTIDENGVGVYANGELLGTDNIVPETVAGELTIGSALYGQSNALLSGFVKDARVYNRVLSSLEIARLANQGA